MIKQNLTFYISRNIIEKHKKYKKIETNHLTNSKKEIDYEFYICDCCKNEIKIETKKDRHKQVGGIVTLPNTVTKRGNIQLALCNSCLNRVIREFEKEENNECS